MNWQKLYLCSEHQEAWDNLMVDWVLSKAAQNGYTISELPEEGEELE